jgi:DNA-3-methyladenine glycosylase
MVGEKKMIPKKFYLNEDVVEVARNLLGKTLITCLDGIVTSGRIVETEAYSGSDDKASQAYPMKLTKRTKTMFLEGGHTYVYLCYGLHNLFNVVTGPEGIPDAVLIRSIEPILGINQMMARRKLVKYSTKVSSGPACCSQALGITRSHNEFSLTEEKEIWMMEEANPNPFEILETTRIGVEYAKEDAKRPWRFLIKKNQWVSSYPK